MTGASTRELMGRMGHASMDAALIYQHRTADRDRAIADAIDLMLTRFDELPETSVAAGASESSSDGHGHGRARVPISDANGCRIQREMASDCSVLALWSPGSCRTAPSAEQGSCERIWATAPRLH